jgi:2-polyprenyl-3-methyl-5-hydroxy-6-metoxy-1,4-benzoquinol methylase
MVYLNPRPAKTEISNFYLNAYYSYQPLEAHKNTSTFAHFVRICAPGYRQSLPFHKRVFSKLIYNLFKGKVVHPPFQQHGKILDIGCGSGLFVKEMEEFGWDSYGVEIDKSAVEYARKTGLKVFCGELTDAHYPEQFFDVVAIRHVIEHVHSPKEVMNEIYRIMKNEGTLILVTPNIDSYEAKIFGRYWTALEVPRHLFFFSLKTIKRLFETTSFEIEKVDWISFLPIMLRGSLRNVRQEGHKSMGSTISDFLKWSFVQSLSYLFSEDKPGHFGAIITIYARKKGIKLTIK